MPSPNSDRDATGRSALDLKRLRMREAALYYPHIEIADVAWLKTALLLWENIYRIVPHSYTPNDDDDVRTAVEADRLRSIHLEHADVRGFTERFVQFVECLVQRPAGLEYDEIAYLHPDKVDAHLYPFLEQHAVGHQGGWIELPREIVRGYMFFLANQVAERRGLARCTDDKYSYAVAAYFSEDANFDDRVYNPDADGFYASLILNDLLPVDLSAVPMIEVIKAAHRSRDERQRFRATVEKFSDQLHDCQSEAHAVAVYADFKGDLLRAKAELKASQGFLNKEDRGCMIAVGVPVALTAFGALVSANADPYALHTISNSLLIGAVAAYHDYRRVKSAKENPHGISYLISLEQKFATAGKYPAFDRYFEEFMND